MQAGTQVCRVITIVWSVCVCARVFAWGSACLRSFRGSRRSPAANTPRYCVCPSRRSARSGRRQGYRADAHAGLRGGEISRTADVSLKRLRDPRAVSSDCQRCRKHKSPG